MEQQNRRWSKRVNRQLSMLYRASSTQYHRGSLLNLSYTGARLVLNATEAEAGPFVQMQIELSDGEICQVTGKKMWQTRTGTHTYVVGVEFYHMDYKAKAQLADWINLQRCAA